MDTTAENLVLKFSYSHFGFNLKWSLILYWKI